MKPPFNLNDFIDTTITIRYVEWFGGIAAATQALKGYNTELVDYVELDKFAVKSFNAINGTNFEPMDINNVNTDEYGNVDLLVASFPCQDFSIAGYGAGLKGNRSSLILTTIDKVREMKNKPKIILLENVKDLLSKKHKEDLEYIKQLFLELGYGWDQHLLNARDFGIPQNRERVYMILTLDFHQTYQIPIEYTPCKLGDILDYSLPTETIKIKYAPNLQVIRPAPNLNPNYVYFKIGKKYIKVRSTPKGKDVDRLFERYREMHESIPEEIYFKNTMTNYNGKIIRLDLYDLEDQLEGKINKVATLGTIENANFDELIRSAKRNYIGTNGISKTIDTRCDQEPKILFKEHSFNQKKDFLGEHGIAKTLRAGDCDNEGKIMFKQQDKNSKIGFIGEEGVSGVIGANTGRGNYPRIMFKKIPFNQASTFIGDKGIANTLVTAAPTFKNKVLYADDLIIHYRKLSTLECWRLMGFSDEAHNKVDQAGVSNAQKARQAGNSIVVNVLVEIFKAIFKEENNGNLKRYKKL